MEWNYVLENLEQHESGVLMVVLHSEGSSPGRQGFKMYVSSQGDIIGSIGGGIMEHKLVEYCRKSLLHAPFGPFIKLQVHQDNIEQDKSGMICSGKQTIGFFYLDRTNISTLEKIVKSSTNTDGVLRLSNQGINYTEEVFSDDKKHTFLNGPGSDWHYLEILNLKPLMQIVGGGHVGLALSQMAHQLGFDVIVYDDRLGLNTMRYNDSAKKTVVVDNYSEIANIVDRNTESYMVIMSFGYRSDKIILQKLIELEFKYIGMMGSSEKINRLFAELNDAGIDNNKLSQVRAPIGLPIHSKTPLEIAVSIMAEIIQVKNGV